MSAPRFLSLYLFFAAAYVLSYVYRTANAVISPELTAGLGVSASSLGLLTSAYFCAFAAMQVPAGMLLDRYGPRRVEPVLLGVAALGALLFAAADGIGGLTLARALIGAGVSVCLMAPLKAIATWYPRERQPSLAAWMMVAGGIGALLSTAPLAAALPLLSWRGVFVVLGVTTAVVAAALFYGVPDTPAPARHGPDQSPWRGVRMVFRHPRLWWIAPLTSLGTGSFMAIQGLWSVPWLMRVDGYGHMAAADHLLIAALATLGGYAALALASTRLLQRGILPCHVLAAGFGLQTVVFLLIVARAPPFTYALWALYGLSGAVNILSYTVLNEGFAKELAGRANTALNLAVFVASFAVQWGIGLMADAAQAWLGVDAAGGLRVAFAVMAAAETLAYAWFALRWRRHTAPDPLAGAAA